MQIALKKKRFHRNSEEHSFKEYDKRHRSLVITRIVSPSLDRWGKRFSEGSEVLHLRDTRRGTYGQTF